MTASPGSPLPAVRLRGDRVTVELVEVPACGPDDVLVAPRYVGVCGTDLHAARLPGHFRQPVTLGHEAVGRVVAVGRAGLGLTPGDRVVLNPNWAVCGSCPACADGRTNLCRTATRERCLGVHEDGALSSVVRVPAAACHRVPDALGLSEAVLVEPLAAALRASRRLGPVRRVLVLGAGPVGLLLAQVLRRDGYDVTVHDPVDQRRTLAETLGIATSDPLPTEPTADAVADCAGTRASFLAARAAVRPGGLVVVVGVSPDPALLDLEALVLDEITVRGSMVYTPEEFADALALAASGVLELAPLVTERIPLADLPDRFDRWHVDPPLGKLVVEFSVGTGS